MKAAMRGVLELHEELRGEAIEAELTVKAGDPSRYWQGRLDGLLLALTLLQNFIDEGETPTEYPTFEGCRSGS